MVRATRRMRSWERAVRPMRAKADFISASPARSSWQKDAIMAGDTVIVVTTHTGFGDVSDILA